MDAFIAHSRISNVGYSGSVAEGLPLLGRVDSRDANLVLLSVGVEDGDRITVSDLDDGAFENAGRGVGG